MCGINVCEWLASSWLIAYCLDDEIGYDEEDVWKRKGGRRNDLGRLVFVANRDRPKSVHLLFFFSSFI